MQTTHLDPFPFPYLFDCPDCGETATVTHLQATDAVPSGINATIRQAVDRALQAKGWQTRGRTLCPECAEKEP